MRFSQNIIFGQENPNFSVILGPKLMKIGQMVYFNKAYVTAKPFFKNLSSK